MGLDDEGQLKCRSVPDWLPLRHQRWVDRVSCGFASVSMMRKMFLVMAKFLPTAPSCKAEPLCSQNLVPVRHLASAVSASRAGLSQWDSFSNTQASASSTLSHGTRCCSSTHKNRAALSAYRLHPRTLEPQQEA